MERLSSRPLRAVAFDALEGLAESLAALQDFAEALRVGRRAAALLTPSGGVAPFVEPESSRREGLLYLSLGHSAEAAGDEAWHVEAFGSWEGALESFRRAAQALQRPARGGFRMASGLRSLRRRAWPRWSLGGAWCRSSKLAIPMHSTWREPHGGRVASQPGGACLGALRE